MKAAVLMQGCALEVGISPLLSWHMEAWLSVCGCKHRVHHLLKLRRAWEIVAASPPTSWNQVAGPTGAAWMCLRRLSWPWPSPFVSHLPDGHTINMLQYGPKMLKNIMLEADHHTVLAKYGSNKVWAGMLVEAGGIHKQIMKETGLAGTGLGRSCLMVWAMCSWWDPNRRLLHGMPGADGTCPL